MYKTAFGGKRGAITYMYIVEKDNREMKMSSQFCTGLRIIIIIIIIIITT